MNSNNPFDEVEFVAAECVPIPVDLAKQHFVIGNLLWTCFTNKDGVSSGWNALQKQMPSWTHATKFPEFWKDDCRCFAIQKDYKPLTKPMIKLKSLKHEDIVGYLTQHPSVYVEHFIIEAVAKEIVEHYVADTSVIEAERDQALKNVGHVESERDNWKNYAERSARDVVYYRGLLEAIGREFGLAARTADDGSIHDHVLNAKLPDLARKFAEWGQVAALLILRFEGLFGSVPHQQFQAPAEAFDHLKKVRKAYHEHSARINS